MAEEVYGFSPFPLLLVTLPSRSLDPSESVLVPLDNGLVNSGVTLLLSVPGLFALVLIALTLVAFFLLSLPLAVELELGLRATWPW